MQRSPSWQVPAVFVISNSFVLSTVRGNWLLEEQLNDFKTWKQQKQKQKRKSGFVRLDRKSVDSPLLYPHLLRWALPTGRTSPSRGKAAGASHLPTLSRANSLSWLRSCCSTAITEHLAICYHNCAVQLDVLLCDADRKSISRMFASPRPKQFEGRRCVKLGNASLVLRSCHWHSF